MMSGMDDLGRCAYEAYGAAVGGVTYDGLLIAAWPDQSVDRCEAWTAFGEAVAEGFGDAWQVGAGVTDDDLAAVGYEAYGNCIGWTAYDGKTIAVWTDQRPDRVAGWVAAARAVALAVERAAES